MQWLGSTQAIGIVRRSVAFEFPDISTGHMVPYGVGNHRLNMGFAGNHLIVTPRDMVSRNDRCEVGVPSSRSGLSHFRGIPDARKR